MTRMAFSFRLKTIIGVALIEAMLLAVLLWKAFAFVGHTAEEQIELRTRAISRLASAMTIDAVLSFDLAGLQSAIDGMLAEPDIVGVAVRDAAGRVLVERHLEIPAGAVPTRISHAITIPENVVGWIDIDLLTTDVERLKQESLTGLLPLGALGMLLVAAFGLVIGELLTRRMAALEHAASRLAAGDLDARVDVRSRDELGRLEAEFNAMAGTIAEQHTALRRIAGTDSVSGLLNRRGFVEAIESHAARGAMGILAVLDLDRFKEINDTLGHGAGDRLLALVGSRLQATVDPLACLARQGGDEFAVFVPGPCAEADMVALGELLLETLRPAYRLADTGSVIACTSSIGLAPMTPGLAGFDQVMGRADMALRAAKSSGRDGFCVFTAAMQAAKDRARDLEAALRRALRTDGLSLLYQPQLSAAAREVVGFEALARWSDPIFGQIAPAEFIPLAERAGLVRELGHFVLETACRQMAAWRRQGLTLVPIAVNVSAVQLYEDDFAADVLRLLDHHGLQPTDLIIEVTEAVFVGKRFDMVCRTLETLRRNRFTVTIDDFGTGTSSLAYLRDMPFDELKIDRSFVRDVDRSVNARTVLQGIIQLARSLGDKCIVVAGIETEAQAEAACALQCDCLQGFHLGKPESAERAGHRLRGIATVRPQRTAMAIACELEFS